jgi:hypothetical protein
MAKRGELLREKQAVARLVDMQMCGAHALDRLAHAQQHRVCVEWTILTRWRVTGMIGLCSKMMKCPPCFRRL